MHVTYLLESCVRSLSNGFIERMGEYSPHPPVVSISVSYTHLDVYKRQRLIGETGLVMLLAHAILLLKYSTQTILTASIGMVSRDTPEPVGDLSARHVIIIVCMSL